VVLKKEFIFYLLKKIFTYLLTMFIALTVIFFIFRLAPGDPIRTYLATLEYNLPSAGINPEVKEAMIRKYIKSFGLDSDLFTQYIRWLRELILNHNFGPSFLSFPRPAQELILERLPWTIGLLSVSTILSWIIGNLFGALAGWRKDTKFDKIVSILAVGFAQIPFYMIALLLVLIFSILLGWLPTRGAYSAALTPSLTLEFVASILKHSILPSLALILTNFAGWFISMRSLVVTIMGEDFLLFAEAKGLKKMRIFNMYVLRNVLLPQITALGISLGFIVSGALIVEQIFVYPGIGSLFASALGLLDYNTINGCLVITVFSVLTANLLVDLLIPFVDPRTIGGE